MLTLMLNILIVSKIVVFLFTEILSCNIFQKNTKNFPTVFDFCEIDPALPDLVLAVINFQLSVS